MIATTILERIRARFTRSVDIAEHTQCTCFARLGELHLSDCTLASDANVDAVSVELELIDDPCFSDIGCGDANCEFCTFLDRRNHEVLWGRGEVMADMHPPTIQRLDLDELR